MSELYYKLLELRKLPNAYEEWASYREAVTDLIINSTEQGSSAALVGAGECNDLDLKRLSGHFGSITLMDRDKEAMHRAFERFSADNIKIQETDLAGIRDIDFQCFGARAEACLRCNKKISTDEFQAMIEDLVGLIDPQVPDGSYDYVVCIGVYSQMLSIIPQMAEVFKRGFPDIDMEGVYRTCSRENSFLARVVGDNLRSIADKAVIFGFERERVGMEGAVEGAFQGIACARKMGGRLISDDLIWPLDISQGKCYKMDFYIVEP